MECLEEDMLVGLFSGGLEPETRARIQEHVDTCSECRILVSHLAQAHAAGAPSLATRTTGVQPPLERPPPSPGAPPTRSPPSRQPPSADEAAGAELSPGMSVDRYIVLHRIGEGGMGVVYAAYDPLLSRNIALKLLKHFGQAPSTAGRQRFAREARAMALLSHPNVVPIFDVIEAGGQLFVAMELVKGHTLADWLKLERRSWREVVQRFLEAGRGLAAAHAAGLVHRDFKPANALVGHDGRVRVMDFGLARQALATQEPLPPHPPLPPSSLDETLLSSPLTQVGRIVGTPRYMAPEQLAGQGSDARADQFSFCVSLYEALYGEPPFQEELRPQAAGEWRVRDAPPGARVPLWLRRLLLRGLSHDPEARFASMEALLEALARDPAVVRRRWVAGLSAGAVLVAAVAVGQHLVGQQGQLCRGAERQLAGVWDAARKESLRQAFSAAGVPYAADAWRGTELLMDAYAARWSSMHREACEATRLRGEQSEEVLSLRMDCLARRLREVDALAGVLQSAGPGVVERSVQAASALTSVDACADVAALKSPIRLPEDAATRAQVTAVREQLAEAQAQLGAGQYAQARKTAEAASQRAAALKYRPLEAEALRLFGRALLVDGEAATSARMLQQAHLAAVAGDHMEEAALSAIMLMKVAGVELARLEEGDAWRDYAGALAERLAHPPRLQAELMLTTGLLRRRQGRYEEALASYERALALKRQAGASPLELSTVLEGLGIVSTYFGQHARASDYQQQALLSCEQALGPHHPRVGEVLESLGYSRQREEKYEEAHAAYARALGIFEEALGKDHLRVSRTLINLGSLLLDEGRPAEARAALQRALPIQQKAVGEDHVMVATTVSLLGDALVLLDQPAEALAHYQRALAAMEKAYGREHPDLAYTLTSMGDAYLRMDRALSALAPLERAERLRATSGVSPGDLAFTRFFLAKALWESKVDSARARQVAAQAREGFTASGEVKSVAEVDAWLASHPARPPP